MSGRGGAAHDRRLRGGADRRGHRDRGRRASRPGVRAQARRRRVDGPVPAGGDRRRVLDLVAARPGAGARARPARTRGLVAIVDAIAVEQHRAGDRFEPEILASLVRAMVLSIERHVASGKTEDALQRFFTILERDHATTRSVAHYAKSTGLSSRRLGELMHARFGRSPKQIVDERVVLEAKRLLAHSELSVKQLAARGSGSRSRRTSSSSSWRARRDDAASLELRRNSPSRRRS